MADSFSSFSLPFLRSVSALLRAPFADIFGLEVPDFGGLDGVYLPEEPYLNIISVKKVPSPSSPPALC